LSLLLLSLPIAINYPERLRCRSYCRTRMRSDRLSPLKLVSQISATNSRRYSQLFFLCIHPTHTKLPGSPCYATISPKHESILNPSQIQISNTLRHINIALRLARGSTLLQLVPEMQALLTSKQNRLSSVIAIDILAAVRRVDPFASSSAVAFSRTFEDDCSIGVGWVWKGNAL
jgi:hypothetical protein